MGLAVFLSISSAINAFTSLCRWDSVHLGLIDDVYAAFNVETSKYCGLYYDSMYTSDYVNNDWSAVS